MLLNLNTLKPKNPRRSPNREEINNINLGGMNKKSTTNIKNKE